MQPVLQPAFQLRRMQRELQLHRMQPVSQLHHMQRVSQPVCRRRRMQMQARLFCSSQKDLKVPCLCPPFCKSELFVLCTSDYTDTETPYKYALFYNPGHLFVRFVRLQVFRGKNIFVTFCELSVRS